MKLVVAFAVVEHGVPAPVHSLDTVTSSDVPFVPFVQLMVPFFDTRPATVAGEPRNTSRRCVSGAGAVPWTQELAALMWPPTAQLSHCSVNSVVLQTGVPQLAANRGGANSHAASAAQGARQARACGLSVHTHARRP